MTAAFKDFLRQQAEKHRAEIAAGKATVEEWRAAVERLFVQLRAWLKESDAEGLVEIEEGQQEINEPGLGRYRIPCPNLQILGK